MASAESVPSKPSAASKLASMGAMLAVALKAAFLHLILGPSAPTWPVRLSVFTAVVRWRSVALVRARRTDPPRSPEEIVRLAAEQREDTEKLLHTPADKLKDGIVREIEIPVKSRGLKGILQELDAEETGERTLKAEWLAHVNLVKAPQTARNDLTIFSLHGGAHVRLSPQTHRPLHVALSGATHCRVFSLDYRLSPEVRFPASLLDAVNGYFYLTQDLQIPAERIIVEGDSAGGNLCLSLMMYLRDAGLPQVGGALLFSPWADLSTSFASWDENKSYDYLVIDDPADPLHPPRLFLSSSRQELEQSHHLAQLDSPYVSPALGPLEALTRLPPLLVQAGGMECLRDEIAVLVRRARKAGTDVTHQSWTDAIHVCHGVQPTFSGASAMRESSKWVDQKFPRPSSIAVGGGDDSPRWTQEVDELLRAEREARLARAGPVPPASPANTQWRYVRTLERLPRIEVKHDGHDAARRAAHEAEEIAGEMALTEVFTPVKVRKEWFA